MPDPHRAVAAALLRRRGRGSGRPVRAAAPVGQHPAHVPVAAQHRDGAGLHWCHRDLDAAGMHLRLRSGGVEVSARPARRRHPPAVPVQRNGFRTWRARVLRASGVVGMRGPLRHAGDGLEPTDPAALSERRLGAARSRHRRCARRLQIGSRDARLRGCGHHTPGGGLGGQERSDPGNDTHVAVPAPYPEEVR